MKETLKNIIALLLLGWLVYGVVMTVWQPAFADKEGWWKLKFWREEYTSCEINYWNVFHSRYTTESLVTYTSKEFDSQEEADAACISETKELNERIREQEEIDKAHRQQYEAELKRRVEWCRSNKQTTYEEFRSCQLAEENLNELLK